MPTPAWPHCLHRQPWDQKRRLHNLGRDSGLEWRHNNVEDKQENNFTNRMQAAKKKKRYNRVKNLGEHLRPKSVAAAPQPPEPDIDIVDMLVRSAEKKLNENQWLANEFKSERKKNKPKNETVVVAQKQRGPISFIYGYEDDDDDSSLYIAIIAVVESERGNGAGKMLLQRFEDLAKKKKMERVTLSVVDENRAKNLYHRMGFRATGYPARFGKG